MTTSLSTQTVLTAQHNTSPITYDIQRRTPLVVDIRVDNVLGMRQRRLPRILEVVAEK